MKTNALRQLDKANIAYELIEYPVDENDLSGMHVVELIGEDPQTVFKTLLTVSDKGNYYVFCLPVDEELDLKKCAKLAKEKNIELVAMKQLLPLTGYIRGGCSPVGMKKQFPTFISETAILYPKICFSAGVRGLQMKLDPNELLNFINASYGDFTKN